MSHGHSHAHPHTPPPTQQKRECENCDDGEGCNEGKKNNTPVMARGIAANLARIDIFQAVETGDLPLVHYIATRSSPYSLKMLDPEGNTALHACARKGHVDVAIYLVDQGIPVDVLNASGHTPLMMALSFGNIAVTAALLQMGADPNKKDSLGFSPIIHAAQFGSVFSFHHLVSNAQVDINDTDNDGHSVLCWACYSGHKDLLDYLVGEHCPQVPHLGTVDNLGRTPMHWAASQNFPEVCALLAKLKCKLCPAIVVLDGADDNANSKNGVCATGRQMLDVRDEEGKTPADLAKSKGHPDTAQALDLERGGIKIDVDPPLKKSESEKLHQFLSSFVPFMCIIFFVMPYFPFWGLAAASGASIGLHMSGRLKWTNKGRTWVPAGLLLASLVGMFWCILMMNLSTFTVGLMLVGLVTLYYTYYTLLFENPGIIPPSDSFFKRALDVAAGGIEPTSEYCRTCKVIKPPRSKHCRDCGVCTDRFDHHCYWISNCVAKKNYRKFYVMLFQCTYLMVIFEYLAITYLNARLAEETTGSFFSEGISHLARNYPQVTWMAVFFFVALIPMGSLWVLHTSLIARDVTTYEMMTKFRSTPGGAPKPYSFARFVNFLQHGAGIFYTSVAQNTNNNAALNV